MFRKTWRVWGMDGHRIKESFCDSQNWDFSNDKDGTRVIQVSCADITGTHDYVFVTIVRDTEEECDREFDGQISDGIFENQRVGCCEELIASDYDKTTDWAAMVDEAAE